ncbi:MAG: hypothetical protein Q7S28_01265 [bacterium]|nr:hypothetical protein [bacterium]
MYVTSWTDVLIGSLQNLWNGVFMFIPSLIGALLVLVLGLVVASGLGALVEKLLEAAKLDGLLARLGLAPYFERAGVRLRGAFFAGRLVYWFLVIAFLLAASDALGLLALSGFLRDVLNYMPNVLAAALIMLASVVIGNVLKKLVTASVLSARLNAGHFLGSLVWWAVVVFGFFAVLTQLNVAAPVVQAVVIGFIAMMALAGGLAFGLGGRDYASFLIGKLREHTEGKR